MFCLTSPVEDGLAKQILTEVKLVDNFGAILEVQVRPVEGDCSGPFPEDEARPVDADEDSFGTILEVQARPVEDDCSGPIPEDEARPVDADEDSFVAILEMQACPDNICCLKFDFGVAL